MMTLKQHNDLERSAGVLCDECGARMEFDVEVERIEMHDVQKPGRPVKCVECGHTGRKL